MKDKLDGTLSELYSEIVGRKVIKWYSDSLTLDNGLVIDIESEDVGWGNGYGSFEDIEIDAAITNVLFSDYVEDFNEEEKYHFKELKLVLLNYSKPIGHIDLHVDAGVGDRYGSTVYLTMRNIRYEVLG